MREAAQSAVGRGGAGAAAERREQLHFANISEVHSSFNDSFEELENGFASGGNYSSGANNAQYGQRLAHRVLPRMPKQFTPMAMARYLPGLLLHVFFGVVVILRAADEHERGLAVVYCAASNCLSVLYACASIDMLQPAALIRPASVILMEAVTIYFQVSNPLTTGYCFVLGIIFLQQGATWLLGDLEYLVTTVPALVLYTVALLWTRPFNYVFFIILQLQMYTLSLLYRVKTLAVDKMLTTQFAVLRQSSALCRLHSEVIMALVNSHIPSELSFQQQQQLPQHQEQLRAARAGLDDGGDDTKNQRRRGSDMSVAESRRGSYPPGSLMPDEPLLARFTPGDNIATQLSEAAQAIFLSPNLDRAAFVEQRFCAVVTMRVLGPTAKATEADEDRKKQSNADEWAKLFDLFDKIAASYLAIRVRTIGLVYVAAFTRPVRWNKARQEVAKAVELACELTAASEAKGVSVCAAVSCGWMLMGLVNSACPLYSIMGEQLRWSLSITASNVVGQVFVSPAARQLYCGAKSSNSSAFFYFSFPKRSGVSWTVPAVCNPYALAPTHKTVLQSLSQRHSTNNPTMGSASFWQKLDLLHRWNSSQQESLHLQSQPRRSAGDAGLPAQLRFAAAQLWSASGCGVTTATRTVVIVAVAAPNDKQQAWAELKAQYLSRFSEAAVFEALYNVWMMQRLWRVQYSTWATRLLSVACRALGINPEQHNAQIALKRLTDQALADVQPAIFFGSCVVCLLSFVATTFCALDRFWTWRCVIHLVLDGCAAYSTSTTKKRPVIWFRRIAVTAFAMLAPFGNQTMTEVFAQVAVVLVLGIYDQSFENGVLMLCLFIGYGLQHTFFHQEFHPGLFVTLAGAAYVVAFCMIFDSYIIMAFHLETDILRHRRPYLQTLGSTLNAIGRMCLPQVAIQGVACEAIPFLRPSKTLQHVSVIVIYIRSMNTLQGLLKPGEVTSLLDRLIGIIDGCIVEAGLVKVAVAGELYVAVTGTSSWLRRMSNVPESYHEPVWAMMTALRNMIAAIDLFNTQSKMNIQLGVGVDEGTVDIGMFGDHRMCFDAIGEARSTAERLALFGYGVLIGECFKLAMDRNNISPLFSVMRCEEAELACDTGSTPSTVYRLVMQGQQAVQPLKISDFEYKGLLGHGGYGSVHLTLEKQTNALYAMKVISKRVVEGVSEWMRRELMILHQISHQHVVKFEYCLVSGMNIYLVMEFIRGGTLRHIIRNSNCKIDPVVLRCLFAELVLAIEYIHSKSIVHRDIKPENCMVGLDGHLKLTDFGLSKFLVRRHQQHQQTEFPDMSAASMSLIQRLLPLRTNPSESQTNLAVMDNITVLLVDDERESRMFAEAVLKQMGFQVVSINSGRKVRKELSRQKIDLILLDVFMEPHDGLQVLKDLKLDLKYSSIPVVMYSGDDNVELLHLCIREGAREYITKPLHPIYKDVLLKHVSAQTRRTQDATEHEMLEPLAEENEDEGEGDDDNEDRKSADADEEADRMRHSGLWTNFSVETVSTIDQDSDNMGDYMPSRLGSSRNRNTVVGTPYYMSPEVVRKDDYDETIDWWSFGVLVYECTLGKYPFQGKTALDLFRQIRRAQPDLSELLNAAEGLFELVEGLLRKNRRARLGASGAQEIKDHLYFDGLDFEQVSNRTTLFRPPCDNQESAMQQIEKGRELFYAVSADASERPESKPSARRSRHGSAPRRVRRSGSHPPSTSLTAVSRAHSAQADQVLASSLHSLTEQTPSQDQYPQPDASWNDEEWAADEAAIKQELGI